MSSKLIRNAGTAFTILKRMARSKVARAGVSLTYDCNQKCTTCDIWRINRRDPLLHGKEMTCDEFGLFAEANPDLIWIALTGGEPYLKKDLKEILDICCEMPNLRLMSITSNGSVPEKMREDLEHFLRNKNRWITLATQVSFEGPKEAHDKISGTPGSFDKALRSLRIIRELEARDSRIRSGISFTMSSMGLPYFRDCLHSLQSSGDLPSIGQVQIGIGQEADYYQWEDEKSVEPNSTLLVEEIKWFMEQFTLKDKLDPYGVVSNAYLRKAVQCYGNGCKFPACVAGQYTCSVGPYWDVHPCLFMFQHKLGNLKDYGYNLQSLLDETRSTWKPLVDDCIATKGCWTLCEDYVMIVLRPWRVL